MKRRFKAITIQNGRELFKSAGRKLIHMQAYSIDFNPIEECFSKIRTNIDHQKPALYLKKAIEKFPISVSSPGAGLLLKYKLERHHLSVSGIKDESLESPFSLINLLIPT